MLDKVSSNGVQTLTALLPGDFIAKFPLSARFPYASNLEVDPRMEERVRAALESVRNANDAKLAELLFQRDPVDCFAQFNFNKFSGCSILASTPRALPLLLVLIAQPFTYGKGKHKVRYRTDKDHYSRGSGEYANYDGEVITAPVPKHIVLCYADSMKPVGRDPITFPTVNVAAAQPPVARTIVSISPSGLTRA